MKMTDKLFGYFVVFEVIKEGYRLRDKIVLFLSIFNSLAYYLLNRARHRSTRLCYYLLRDCLIRNQSGTFCCRASTNDALIVSETHESQLKQYFDGITGGNFVDIGAHIGKYTVKLAMQMQDRGARVIAIEAHPQNYEALVHNIKLNSLTNVTALNIGCLDSNGEVRLYRDSNSTATSSYSIVRRFQGDYINIEAKKLDDILRELKIDAVSLMKIDIEGAEAECLKGGHQFLKENRIRKVLFESSEEPALEECKSILEQCGYTLKYVGLSYYLAEPGRRHL